MNEMIDQHLIKTLRKERYWSQEQLASISGLSLRTIQRIEKGGKCSLESQKALAATFEVNTIDLAPPKKPVITKSQYSLNTKIGFAGAAVGMFMAYLGITISLLNHYITYEKAGLYYGCVGIFCGISCAIIGKLSKATHQSIP